jgi:inner membrane protein
VILWHLGVAALLVYVTLGRRRIDYRYVLIGAVLPDVVDGVLGLVAFDGPAGRWVAHSLSAVIVVAVAVLVVLRGNSRRAAFGIPVGWLTHLVADGMWEAPKTFLWPAFGTEFSATPAEPYSWDLLAHPLQHWTTWAAEAAGAALLAWFWVAFRLGREGRFRLFLRDGYLRP